MQMILVAMAIVSCRMVNGAPQFFPYNHHNIANDIHNHITGLTYDINNRVAAAANAAIANSLASSTYALNAQRYPTNGNTFIRPFYIPGGQGLYIISSGGNGFGSSGVAVSGGNRFSSGGSAFASVGSSGGSVRPTSSSLRPSSFRPTTNAVRQPSTSSFRPSSTPVRPVSVAVGSPNRFAVAGAGPLPGGGVSASAGAVSISG
jgi:hypothetical protein